MKFIKSKPNCDNNISIINNKRNISLKKGSYLFKGKVKFSGLNLLAYLNIHYDLHCESYPVLIGRDGSFCEVIILQKNTLDATLSLNAELTSSLSLKIETVIFRRISFVERRLILQYLTWETWHRFTKSQRHHYQLFWYTPLFSSRKAYRCVQQYRHKYGTLDYDQWIDRVDNLSASENQLIKRFSNSLALNPAIVPKVLIDVRFATPLAIDATFQSIQESLLRPRAIVILHDSEVVKLPTIQSHLSVISLDIVTLDDLLQYISSMSEGHWIFIKAGCRLSPHAITWFASLIQHDSSLTCVYSDHDFLDSKSNRYDPHFKPDWSEEMAFASGYPGQVLCVNSHYLVDTIIHNHDVSAYALMLYAGAQRQSIVKHIPCVLWHMPDFLRNKSVVSVSCLQTFLQQQKIVAKVSRDPVSGGVRVQYPIPDPTPLVSIIIPTRDRLDLLIPCINSILSLTTYPNYEILIIDNQSEDTHTLNYFVQLASESRIKVISFDHPFNYSAINNFAATQANGNVLCLLNNDTEVVTPEWLNEMVSCLFVSGVAVVGAQLRYPDGRLQHAGDLVGGANHAGHLHGSLKKDDLGYMNRVALRQDLSAVTAACLLTYKDIYQSLGGLDQHNLKVAFNDVDYCLRVREAGYRVLYTPYAKLIHYESESRGSDITSKQRRRTFKEAQYLRKRWSDVMMNDPFYNPNLNYYRCDFSLVPAPMIKKPWD